MGDISDIYGGNGFDCESVEPDGEYLPLPAGWYTAMAEEADIVETKAGTGCYLKVRFSILDNEYQNRKVFTNINIVNPSDKAQEIGMKQLSGFGRAVGAMTVKDSADLLNKPLMIKLSVRNDEQYGDSNEVKAYKPVDGKTPTQESQRPTAQMPAQKTSAPSRPWQK